MKNKLIVLVVILVFMFSCTNHSEKQLKLVGYIAGWKDTDFNKLDLKKFTHINYAFANIVNGEVVCEMPHDTVTISKLNELRVQNPKIKILISVGGWVWSNNFSDVALTAESRAKFVKSAIRFVDYWGFDGVDIDWEYPGLLGEDNIFRKEDKQNFTYLLRDLRLALNKHSEEQNRKEKYLLTIATGAFQQYINNTELGKCSNYLDFINIMSYDIYSGKTAITGHHAGFKLNEQNKKNNTVTNSIKIHLEAGVPKEKLVVGIPFYGRIWDKLDAVDNNGLYQPVSVPTRIVPYSYIVKQLKNSDFTYYWDEQAQAPYLFNKKDSVFISYDNPRSIKIKCEYVKEMNLGGFMYWEYNNDNGTELLDLINNCIKTY